LTSRLGDNEEVVLPDPCGCRDVDSYSL